MKKVVPIGDSYDLALGLRRRLADTEHTPTESVASQLQLAARARLGSGPEGQRSSRGRRFRRAGHA